MHNASSISDTTIPGAKPPSFFSVCQRGQMPGTIRRMNPRCGTLAEARGYRSDYAAMADAVPTAIYGFTGGEVPVLIEGELESAAA